MSANNAQRPGMRKLPKQIQLGVLMQPRELAVTTFVTNGNKSFFGRDLVHVAPRFAHTNFIDTSHNIRDKGARTLLAPSVMMHQARFVRRFPCDAVHFSNICNNSITKGYQVGLDVRESIFRYIMLQQVLEIGILEVLISETCSSCGVRYLRKKR